jgi:putative chitinase
MILTIHERYKSLLEKHGINTPLRLSHFIAQIDHESGLKPISENLNYSINAMLKVFPKYFKDVDTALRYHTKPILIANRVYANRMGNGNEASGEGWKYRGRGFIQITGKDNYKQLSKDTGLDFLSFPDSLLSEPNSMVSALWYWDKINGNKYADKDDIKGLTKAINGGFNGIDHRKQLLVKYKSYFGIV